MFPLRDHNPTKALPIGTVLLIGVTAVVWWLVAAQIAASPGSAVPMVGASGAVSAVMGAYLVLFPKARIDTLFFFVFFVRVVPLPAWIMLGYWILIQLLASTVTPSGAGGVAYMAHVGGFAAGLLLVWPFRAGRPARRRAGAARGRW